MVFNNLSCTSGKNFPIIKAAVSTDIFFRYRIRLTSGIKKKKTKTKALTARRRIKSTKRILEENQEKYSSVFIKRKNTIQSTAPINTPCTRRLK